MIIDVNFQEIDCKINANLCEPAKVIKPRFSENEEAIYKAGYSEGQSSMLDPEKVIEKTAIGTTTLTIDDISEIPHEVEVQLGSYNLLDMEDIDGMDVSINGYKNIQIPYSIKPNIVYTMSWDIETDVFPYHYSIGLGTTYYRKDKADLWNVKENGRAVLTFSATQEEIDTYGSNLWGRLCRYSSGTEANIKISNIQLIEGTTDLPFMPYDTDFSGISLSVNGDSYTSPSNGLIQGIKSVSPDMTFTTNEGIKIEARYHKSWGMQEEYDRFWDAFFDSLNNTRFSFAGAGWNNTTFKPNRDLKPISGYEYFRNSHISGDLVEILKNLNIELDCSGCTDFTYFFSEAMFTRVGVIDTRKSSVIGSMFHSNGYIETIDKIILSDTPTQVANYYSFYCANLVNITFEGVIGSGEWWFGASKKLSKASITSIINALYGAEGYTPANPLRLSKTAVTTAFGSTTSDEWLNLIATKSNWTISLV